MKCKTELAAVHATGQFIQQVTTLRRVLNPKSDCSILKLQIKDLHFHLEGPSSLSFQYTKQEILRGTNALLSSPKAQNTSHDRNSISSQHGKHRYVASRLSGLTEMTLAMPTRCQMQIGRRAPEATISFCSKWCRCPRQFVRGPQVACAVRPLASCNSDKPLGLLSGKPKFR
jgi:hypothetical protein